MSNKAKHQIFDQQICVLFNSKWHNKIRPDKGREMNRGRASSGRARGRERGRGRGNRNILDFSNFQGFGLTPNFPPNFPPSQYSPSAAASSAPASPSLPSSLPSSFRPEYTSSQSVEKARGDGIAVEIQQELCTFQLSAAEGVDKVTEIQRNVAEVLSQFRETGALPIDCLSLMKESNTAEFEMEEKKRKQKEMDREHVVQGDPRPYQMEFLRQAMERNIIVYLPTGMGKTLIAVLLIKHFCTLEENPPSTSPSASPSSSSSRSSKKWSIFLTSSVPLVLQQSSVLRANTPFTIGSFCSDYDTDEVWIKNMSESRVLVMTHGVLQVCRMHYSSILFLLPFLFH